MPPKDSRPPRGQRNVLGLPLQPCGLAPPTGWWRDGCCVAAGDDRGQHVVCAVMTAAFLAHAQARGNDLATPRPDTGFPGLVPGDRWCVCLARWVEALQAGVAPPVVLEATHEHALAAVPLATLQRHAAGPA